MNHAAQSEDSYAQYFFAEKERYRKVDPCEEAMHTVKEAVTPGYQEAKVGPIMAFLKRMLAVIERVLQTIFPSPKTVEGVVREVSARSVAPTQEQKESRSVAAGQTVDQEGQDKPHP